jgi:cyclohexa-1,5-dienecarbonyl-CoA hydratase
MSVAERPAPPAAPLEVSEASETPRPPVLVERAGVVATLTLNAPPLNILDLQTLAALGAEVESLAGDRDLAVLVLRGAGSRAFSAGVSVQDHTADRVAEMLATFHGALERLRQLEAVTVAAVQGHCLGGGMELAMACDLLVATEDARFGQPEIELGCFPPYAAALYPALLGPGRTLDLLLTGRTLGIEEAERLGIVTRRAPAGGLDGAVDELTAAIQKRSRPVARMLKRAVRAGRDRGFAAALPETERIYVEDLCATEDMAEGLAAFLEKRPPAWRHR